MPGGVFSFMRRLERIRLWAFFGVLVANSLSSCKNGPEAVSGDYPPALLPQKQEPGPVREAPIDNNIRIGDSLELFVNEDSSFDGIYLVREGGDIIIPRVGRILVAGMSTRSAKDAIEKKLEEGQLKQASIIVDRVGRAAAPRGEVPSGSAVSPREGGDQSIVVFITDQVKRPGQHKLAMPGGRPIGVYEALLIAGGMTRFADDQKVHILRADEEGVKHRIPVNVRLIEKGEAPDMIVGHGDIIVVPEKVFGTGF